MVDFTEPVEHIHNFWPESKSIQSFLSSTGTAIVQQFVRDFFNDLMSDLADTKSDIKDMSFHLTSLIEKLHDSLKEYNETSNINEVFIR